MRYDGRHHPAEEALHRLVDGELDGAELAALERHLAACARCGDAVDRLERLRRLAAAAPREVAPPEELWGTLRDRLPRVEREPDAAEAPAAAVASTASVTPAAHRGLWATAAALLLLAAGATAASRGWGGGAAAPQAARSAVPALPPAAVAPDAAEAPFAAALRAELQARRHVLTPETVAAVEESLRQMDAAIAATRAALVADPDNVHLESMLERVRRQQAEYVRGALTLASDE